MAKWIGRRASVGLGKETSYGVRVAASQTVPKLNFTFDDKANKARSGDQFGNIAGEGSQAIVTARFAEGSLEGDLNANSFGLLMLATLGTDTPSSYATSAYKHTYTLNNSNLHQSLSVFCVDPIGSVLFKGCVVDTLEIDVTESDIVKFVCGMKGRKGNDDSFTAAPAVDYKFVGRDLVFKVAADVASLGAASALSIKDLKVTINKNADFDWVLGTIEPENIPNQQFSIKGSLTLNYEDRTWRDYMCNGSTKALSILLTNTRDTIGSAGNPAIYLEFPVVDFSEWQSERANDNIATQKINFNVLYDVANARLISSAYIQNTVASY